MNALGVGMVLTIPVAGLAIYMTGGSLSYSSRCWSARSSTPPSSSPSAGPGR